MILLWLAVAALVGLLFTPYLNTALVGITLAVVLHPLHCSVLAFLEKRLGGGPSRRHLAALSAHITELVALVVFVVGLLLPALVLFHNRHFLADQGLDVYQKGLDWVRGEKQVLSQWMAVPGWMDLNAAAVSSASDNIGGLGNLNQLMANLPPLGALAMETAVGLGIGVAHLLVLLLIVHVTLLHGPDLWEHIGAQTPQPWRRVLGLLGERARVVLRSVYLNHGLTAVAAFVLAVPVFWFILGPPYFFLAAVLAGLFQAVPLLGSSVLVAGMTLYLFLAGQSDKAWLCVCVAGPLVVAIPDLLIRPALSRFHGRIAPSTMLIGFLMGFEAFGLAGFVLGPLFLELFVCFTMIMLYGPAGAGGAVRICGLAPGAPEEGGKAAWTE